MGHDGKTEQPTQQRRDKAREQGQVARSRELSGALALLAAIVVLVGGAAKSLVEWQVFTRNIWNYAADHDLASCYPMIRWTATAALAWVTLPMAAAWGAAVLGSIAQGGVIIAPAALQPKIDRLNPAQKFSQLFSMTAVSGILKALLPAGVIIWLSVSLIMRDWPRVLSANTIDVHTFVGWISSVLFEITWKGALVMAVWSGADYMLVRQKHESDLKMSREEIREEMKQSEGNPQIKMRIRRLQRQTRRGRMLKDVEKASVVVVNPTHFAVALEYGPNFAAPVVVAKGRNALAEQIKQAARWNSIPIMENPPLAQALYRTIQIGQPIPSKLYTAVAEILAFVYRMQQQAAQRRSR
jgi:flagellar biosynthetic protein FlhB